MQRAARTPRVKPSIRQRVGDPPGSTQVENCGLMQTALRTPKLAGMAC